MSDNLQSIMALLGPLLGAGAGSYFGLKGALNGLRERTERIEQAVNENKAMLIQHRLDSSRYVSEVRRDIQDRS